MATIFLYGKPCQIRIHQLLKAIKMEQSVAHVSQKPFSISKLKSFSLYIMREIDCPCSCPIKKYLLLRDRAFFLMQYFAGGRAFNLCQPLIQKIKQRADSQGIVLCQTVGKTTRCMRPHIVNICKCSDKTISPVEALCLDNGDTSQFKGSVCIHFEFIRSTTSLGDFKIIWVGGQIACPFTILEVNKSQTGLLPRSQEKKQRISWHLPQMGPLRGRLVLCAM